MRRAFRQLPIRRKLIAMIMVTSLAVVLLATIGYLAVDYYVSREDLKQEVEGQARLILDNVEAALAFLDQDTAHEALGTLKASPNLRVACLYDKDDALFASYVRPDAYPCEGAPAPEGTTTDASRVM